MEPSTCSICLDTIDTSLSFTLKCNHTFHLTCIEEWKKVANTCPFCRDRDGSTNTTVNGYNIRPD